MAIPAAGVWEVRPTNGTADAGGGFNPAGAGAGTDYSQQDAVQVAFNGTTITATTAGVSSVITITGYTVATTDRRNFIAITGGTNFTTGIYEITAVDTTLNTWTLDRNCATAAASAMTGNMGGARNGFSTGTTTLQSSYVSGNKIWVKNEAWDEAITISTSGSGGSPIIIEGYNTTRGDAPTGTNRPVLDRNSAGGDAITISASHIEIRHIRVTRAGDAGFAGTTGPTVRLYNCRIYNNGGEGIEDAVTGNWILIDTEIDTNANNGMSSALVIRAIGSYIHDNTGTGLSATTSSQSFAFCIFDSNTSHGIQVTTGVLFLTNNTFYNQSGASADGLNVTNPTTVSFVMNCIFDSNGRYGVGATDADSIWEDYNCFHSNGTAARNPANGSAGGWGPATHDSTSDPQFTNAASGDFSIGTNLKAAGFPGAFAGSTSTGYLDMGAVQRQEPASGSGGGPVFGGMVLR